MGITNRPALQYVPTMQLIEAPKKHVRQAEQFLPQQYVEECRVDKMLWRSEEYCSDLQGVGLPLPRCCPSGCLPFRTAQSRLLRKFIRCGAIIARETIIAIALLILLLKFILLGTLLALPECNVARYISWETIIAIMLLGYVVWKTIMAIVLQKSWFSPPASTP